jgi:hypothetical protein
MEKLNKPFALLCGQTVLAILAVLTFAFTACNKTVTFTDLNAISTHLAKTKAGTLDKPISMIVTIPLGDMTNAGSGWQRLLMIVENAGKNVAFDLSACEMTGTEFNPFSQVSSGKFFIVSLVLPDAAKSILGNRDASPSFLHFYNLRTVSAKEITTIGRNAFKDCTSLRSADFPLIANIADGTYNGCTSLEKVGLPLVTSIGNEAFNNCTSLPSISIPLATSIGESAFDNCTSMTSVSFPASAAIVNNPFRGSGSLTSFSLIGAGDLTVIEDGKALVRKGTELIAYPSASGSIVMDTITIIGRSALNGNTNLSSVSFPAATSIGIRAFRGCTSLISASFPAVTAIGAGAFEYTGTTTLTISLGSKVPTLGNTSDGTFAGVTGAKPVTVKVPAGVTGYGQSPVNTFTRNWGNNFRGGGNWSPNANIELTIEYVAAEVADVADETAQ